MGHLQYRLLLVQICSAGETLHVERDKSLCEKKSVIFDSESFKKCLEPTVSSSPLGRQEMDAQNNLCQRAWLSGRQQEAPLYEKPEGTQVLLCTRAHLALPELCSKWERIRKQHLRPPPFLLSLLHSMF